MKLHLQQNIAFRNMLRPLLAIAAAAALLICRPSLEEVAANLPDDLATGPIPELEVMSYNVECPLCEFQRIWPWRLPEFKEQLDFYRPDLIGVQELIIPFDAGHFMDTLPRGENGEALYAHLCRANCDSAIIYRKDRFKLLANGAIWLTSFPYRYASWAVLQDKGSGNHFAFVNTHFDNHQPNQEISAQILLPALAPLRTAGLPIVLTGDFNASPSGYAFVHEGKAASRRGYELLAAEFRNTYQMTDDCRIYSNHPDPETNRFSFEHHIDHIFLDSPEDGGWNVEKYAVDYWWKASAHSPRTWYPSDHFPVISRISYATGVADSRPNRECEPRIVERP